MNDENFTYVGEIKFFPDESIEVKATNPESFKEAMEERKPENHLLRVKATSLGKKIKYIICKIFERGEYYKPEGEPIDLEKVFEFDGIRFVYFTTTVEDVDYCYFDDEDEVIFEEDDNKDYDHKNVEYEYGGCAVPIGYLIEYPNEDGLTAHFDNDEFKSPILKNYKKEFRKGVRDYLEKHKEVDSMMLIFTLVTDKENFVNGNFITQPTDKDLQFAHITFIPRLMDNRNRFGCPLGNDDATSVFEPTYF